VEIFNKSFRNPWY